MSKVIMMVEQITPGAITDVLRREGVLPQGEVQAVVRQANPAFNSTVTHLELTYSPTAPYTAPRRLLLKRNLTETWAVQAGAREVAFYEMIARLPDRLPMIVPCFDAVFDAATGNSHVLLQDVSATHRAPLTREQVMLVGDNVPADMDLWAVVDSLARFHAYWWQHSLLGSGVAQVGAWWRDQANYTHEIGRREAAWASLIAAERTWFPEQLQHLYEHALTGLPRLWEQRHVPRLAMLHNLTLTHNDAYFSNFLCPNEGTTGETYLIDWQGPAAGRGADDLVNLCATFWTSTQRNEAQRETKILRRYHDGLRLHGVQNYAWEDLLVDYRIGVTEWLFQPVQDRADGAGKEYWWPKLQCLAAAFQDLNCAEMLKS